MLEEIIVTVVRVLSRLPGREVLPDNTLEECGLDSMDFVEVMLDLEEAFPEVELYDYMPKGTSTARDIAAHVVSKVSK